jgi:hypothetical protein
MKQIKLYAAVCLAALLGTAAAQAQPVTAGQLSDVKGHVQIKHNGALVAAGNGSAVESGDDIEVGSGSSATLNTADHGTFALIENSEFLIDKYAYNPGGASVAHYVLASGALRTTSGSIGKNAGDDYLMSAPEADVHIHGTDYQLDRPSTGGLAVTVFSGVVSVSNSVGSIDIGSGQGVFVPSRSSKLVARLLKDLDRIITPPIIIHIGVSPG